jgi:predicted nucleic acid-binding protein
MARVLLDTNILVYLASPASPRHALCQHAVETLIQRGGKPAFSSQVVYEFWSVATRPAAANGLGWPVADARRAIDGFRREFDLLHDSPEVLDIWLDMVVAKANGVSRLLTCNAADFPPDSDIAILTPNF